MSNGWSIQQYAAERRNAPKFDGLLEQIIAKANRPINIDDSGSEGSNETDGEVDLTMGDEENVADPTENPNIQHVSDLQNELQILKNNIAGFTLARSNPDPERINALVAEARAESEHKLRNEIEAIEEELDKREIAHTALNPTNMDEYNALKTKLDEKKDLLAGFTRITGHTSEHYLDKLNEKMEALKAYKDFYTGFGKAETFVNQHPQDVWMNSNEKYYADPFEHIKSVKSLFENPEDEALEYAASIDTLHNEIYKAPEEYQNVTRAMTREFPEINDKDELVIHFLHKIENTVRPHVAAYNRHRRLTKLRAYKHFYSTNNPRNAAINGYYGSSIHSKRRR